MFRYSRVFAIMFTAAIGAGGLLPATMPGVAAAATAPAISIADAIVGESSTTVTLPVTLSASSATTVTVNYAMNNGTAGFNADYSAPNGTLTFAPGIRTQNLVINIVRDKIPEGFENFFVSLGAATGGSTIAKAIGQVGIVDNDTVVATPRVVIRDAIVDESVGFATVA